ncbi:DUF1672 family protein [Staphylococcus aureus]|nr:DUF1672 family protein [Staphylococcus aureus]
MFKRIKLILIATIILSGCSTTNNESNNETKSVPEEMEASKYVGQGVGTVLSGFEYRAQKEKYDNLYKFLKENEKKYQYTGFTKEAINKTQNVGYQNEYFYITYLSRNLKEYRKYYEPLIHKKDKEFKEGMQRARKELNYTANTDVVSTLFSTKKNFTKDNTVDDVIELSNKLKDKPNMPQKSQVTIQLGKPSINTKKPFYDDINPIEG